MQIRKIIGFAMLALSIIVTLFTLVRILVTKAEQADWFNIWWSFAEMAIVEAAFIIISLRPNTTSKQMVFNFRAKKFEWKRKKKLRDVGNYQIVLNGTVALWLSLLTVCRIMMDLTGRHFWETLFIITLSMFVVVFAVIIWLCIIMYRTGGYEQ